MEANNQNYLNKSKQIWIEELKKTGEQFNEVQYNPVVTQIDDKNHKIVWLNYGQILTTMIPAQKWPQQMINNHTSFAFQAKAQTKGRGQNTNTWASPPGNMYLTYLTQIKKECLPLLPVICTSAIIKTINQLTPDIKVHCKWINDIFIEQKKVGGLLTRCDIYGEKFIATFGVGVNIDEAPLENSTCINKETKNSIKIVDFSRKLVQNINKALDEREVSLNNYKNHLVFMNKEVKIMDVTLTKVMHQGVFKGINEYGHAILVKNNQQITVSEGRMRI